MTYSVSTGFTPSERHVQRQLGQGKSPTMIAKEMDVNPSTIRTMIANMKQKTGSSTVRELTAFFLIDLKRSPSPEYRRQLFAGTADPDLDFYQLLGRGQPGTVCRRSMCTEGVVKYSVLCRQHHVESVMLRSCPFHGDA